MSVISLPGSGAMTAEQRRVFALADAEIVRAINDAKSAGVPQGLIVALLHGQAHRQTAEMMANSNEG